MVDDKKPVAPATQAAGLQSPADRGARATDDKPAVRAGEAPAQFTAEQVATPPATPPQVGGKMVAVIVGPYRGNMLTMPEAEAQQAIDDHWAVEPPPGAFDANNPPEHSHDLTDEERAYAVEAANTWAANVNKPPEPPPEPPPEGGAVRRAAMTPDRPATGYTTKSEPEPRKSK